MFINKNLNKIFTKVTIFVFLFLINSLMCFPLFLMFVKIPNHLVGVFCGADTIYYLSVVN